MRILSFCLFLLSYQAFAGASFLQQNTEIDSLRTLIEKQEFDRVEKILSRIDTLQLSTIQKADYYYAKAQILDLKSSQDFAFGYYSKAKRKYLSENRTEDAMMVNYQMAFSQLNSDPNIYLEEISEYVRQHDNKKILSRYCFLKGYEAILNQNIDKAIDYLNQTTQSLSGGEDSLYMHKTNSLIGLIYSQMLENPVLGLEYEMKLYPYLERNNLIEDIISSKINQAVAYYSMQDYKQSISLLQQADSIGAKQYELNMRQHIYETLSLSYEKLGDYKNALAYVHLGKIYADSVNYEKQNIAIQEYQIQYETEKKELENNFLKQENILLDDKQKTNRILFVVALGLFISLLITTYFIVKYLIRKKKIAEQEKIIEQQKTENILKTQEINIIDAMIEGQEKERQFIAQDMHDNLGSMLTALRLNFQHLRNQLKQNENPLFEKTDLLIDDAYQNVRRIAHAKNSGVVADKGLIPSLKILAEKTSVPNRLKIEVSSFGMNSRLDMPMEIMIFRIIQELITNSIKHASASEISINLTQHQNDINIMVEDNGKGFKKQAQEGMGLSNIRKKISSYNGTLDIDSGANGTTTIINIPII